MTSHDAYVAELRELVTAIEDRLDPTEAAAVRHLIDHDEGGEAMLSLAWFIVDGQRQVSNETVQRMRALVEGLVDEADYPPNFADYGRSGTA